MAYIENGLLCIELEIADQLGIPQMLQQAGVPIDGAQQPTPETAGMGGGAPAMSPTGMENAAMPPTGMEGGMPPIARNGARFPLKRK